MKKPILSPSVHEACIARYFKGKDDPDPVIRALHDAMARLRDRCTQAQRVSDAVLQNQTLTEAARNQSARAKGHEILEPAFKQMDHAYSKAKAEIAATKSKLRGPVMPKDTASLANLTEIRVALRGMKPEERKQIIDAAIADNDVEIACAVLGVGKPWLCGLTDVQQAMSRVNWQRRNHADELDQLARHEGALEAARIGGNAATHFFDDLTNHELIRKTEAQEKKVAQLLQQTTEGSPS
jgi:hypothetical protein